MKKYSVLLGMVAASVLLTGCITTNPKITADDTANYKSPRAFMQDQLAQGIIGFKEKKVLSDGTIVYTAYFNRMNTRYLRKPEQDASGYCLTKKGSWEFRHRIGLENNSAASSLVQELGELNAREQAGASSVAVQKAGQMAVQRYQSNYHRSGMGEVDHAVNNGYFGDFSCTSPTGNWSITIKPIALNLEPASHNSNSDNALTIFVSITEQ